MNNRNNPNRDLYTRSGELNSERWSQQFLSDSQDWGSQCFLSQDLQRPSAAPAGRQSSFLQSLSQGSVRSGGPGTSSRTTPQPSGLGDVSLARDIRFGLHTILSVMRDLPNQLKDVTSEVVKTSQQPEETSNLIKETSEKLEGLILSLEKKASLLLENKENSEVLQKSLAERDGQLDTLISKVEGIATRSKQDELALFEEHKNATKKEVRKEVKKIWEAVSELKSSKLFEENLKPMQGDVAKLNESLGTHTDVLLSAVKEKDSTTEYHIDQLSVTIKENLKEVHSMLSNIIDKVSVLPQKIHAQVNLAVNDAFQASCSAGSLFVSPIERKFSYHRPMIPFSESYYRSQVSPVAQVHPQILTRPISAPASKLASQQEVQRGISRSGDDRCPSLVSTSHRPFAKVWPATLPNANKPIIATEVDAHNITLQQKECKNDNDKLEVKLLESETQHFTPEPVSIKSSTDSEESIVLHCDSGSGSSSSDEYPFNIDETNNVVLTHKGVNQKYSGISTDKLFNVQSKAATLACEVPRTAFTFPRPVATPNLRKTPAMVVKDGKTENFPSSKETFAPPINPVPVKKSKLSDGISPVNSKAELESPIEYTAETISRTRRYLTPVCTQGLRFKFSSRKKKT